MTQAAPSVVIEKVIPAEPCVVFDAWLDAEALQRFMCGGPGVRVKHVECDPRVGGRFLIVMTVDGTDIPHRGKYIAIERYTRLVFTWLSPYAGEGSQVTLHFAEADKGATRLTLEHIGLEEAERSKHLIGWSHILGELSQPLGLSSES
jgi:uncharacterized protein YndB with AHSA1/START domain